MVKRISLCLSGIMTVISLHAFEITSPNGSLLVNIDIDKGKTPCYNITLDGKTMLHNSPLGLSTNIGEMITAESMTPGTITPIDKEYTQDRIKKSHIHFTANEANVDFVTPQGKNDKKLKWSVTFVVSDNDVAFRYNLPKEGDTGSIYINSEATGFRFPTGTTTFLTPQSDPMIGWKRTKPSYEEEYTVDAPMDKPSQYGHGYTFPCLFKINNDGWVLVSETGVDSHYCASHMSDYQLDGLYTVAFPMPGKTTATAIPVPLWLFRDTPPGAQ